MRKVNIIYVVCVLLCCSGLPACKKNIGLTTVSVADSVRHYYPLIAGQVLNLSYEIENTGDQPLIIHDIQSSCGCIVPLLKQGERMVLPERKARLRFRYESAKNIGYVQHVIRIYGNIHPNGMVKLVFDVNVVPHADYTRDYEELYKEEVERSALVRGLVDGDESEKGYYIDDVSRDSRESPRYPWRGEE